MEKRFPFLIGLIIILVLIGSQSIFIVNQTEKALVIQLGDPVDKVFGPGLHFKIPLIQTVVRFDARVLDYEARAAEALTSDKKAIVLDNYARWRIIDPLQFYRSVRTIPGAQARLDDVVYSQLRAQVGRHSLTEVVSSKRSGIMADVTRRASDIMKEYGIEVVDVRIKRTDLPAETSGPFSEGCGPNASARPSSTAPKVSKKRQNSVPKQTGNGQLYWQRPTAVHPSSVVRAMRRRHGFLRKLFPAPRTSISFSAGLKRSRRALSKIPAL